MSVDVNLMPTDEDREMLRQAVRGFLSSRWCLRDASSINSGVAAGFWQEVVAQGLVDFGRDPTEGGLRELAITMEEFGFAACPLPLFASGIANLLLCHIRDRGTSIAELNRLLDQRPMLAIAFGEYDNDKNAGQARAGDNKISGTLKFVEGAASASHTDSASAPGSAPRACA